MYDSTQWNKLDYFKRQSRQLCGDVAMRLCFYQRNRKPFKLQTRGDVLFLFVLFNLTPLTDTHGCACIRVCVQNVFACGDKQLLCTPGPNPGLMKLFCTAWKPVAGVHSLVPLQLRKNFTVWHSSSYTCRVFFLPRLPHSNYPLL